MQISEQSKGKSIEGLQAMREMLEEIKDIYSRLLELSQIKREVIIRGDIKELAQITQAEELLIMGAGGLEAKRFSLQKEIAGEYGVEPQELNLSQLEKLYGQTGESLVQTGKQLSLIVDQLRKINLQNKQLIEYSLQYLEFTADLIAQQGTEHSFYGDMGLEVPIKNKDRPLIFDKKA
jgi:flagellar biosynthesis/type III secretory pathway chaperone